MAARHARSSAPFSFRRTATAVAVVLSAGVLAPVVPGGVALAYPPAAPAAGALDATFDIDGFATVPVPGSIVPGEAWARGLSRPLFGPDGTVGVAAIHSSGQPGLARLQSDGSPDTSYGPDADGTADLAQNPDAPFQVLGQHVAASDGEGRFYVAGAVEVGEVYTVAVQRFDVDGRPDETWGSTGSGVAETAVEGGATALALDATGRPIVGFTTSSGEAAVLRLDLDGNLDRSWSDTDDNVTRLPLPVVESTDLVAVDVDGEGRVYALAAQDSGEKMALVARLTPDGVLDSGPEGYGDFDDADSEHTGYSTQFVGNGESGASDLAVLDDGGAWVVGTKQLFFTDPTQVRFNQWTEDEGFAFFLHPDGTLEGSFGSDGFVPVRVEGQQTQVNAAALDGDRLVLAGSAMWDGSVPALARLTRDGQLDDTFGAPVDGGSTPPGGTQLMVCPEDFDSYMGAFTGVAVDEAGRILTTGNCGSDPVMARFLGASSLSGLTLTADSPTVLAAPSTVETGQVPADALDSALAELAASPLRYSPLRYSPLRYSPLRYSPLRYSPLRYSPLDVESLAEVTLAQVPLAPSPGGPADWDEVLQGTPYENHPLQTVFVRDLLDLTVPDQVDQAKYDQISNLNLDQVDLTRTSLRDSSLAAFLLDGVTLAELPAPWGGWCYYLSYSGGTDQCADPNAQDDDLLDSATLLTIEAAGADLTGWLDQGLALTGVELTTTPLGALRLSEFDFTRTALGQVTVDQLSDAARFCACETSEGAEPATLAEVQAAGAFNADATLAQLLLDGFASPWIEGASIAELLPGLVDPQEVPWEGLNLDSVIHALPLAADFAPSIGYTAQFSADCSTLSELSASIQLPPGARFIPGSVSLTARTDGGEPRDVPWSHPSWEGAEMQEQAVSVRPLTDMQVSERRIGDFGREYVTVIPGEFACSGPAEVTYSLRAVAPRQLGSTTANAFVYTFNGGALSAIDQAPVDVLDPHDLVLVDGEPQTKPLAGGTLELGYLGRRGAADYYELPVTAGETVTLTLSHLPADYDLLVYDTLALDENGTPEALENTPLRYSPLRYSPLRYSPTDDAEPSTEPTVAAPEDLQGVPLLDRRLRAASAARGEQVEAVRVHVREGEPETLIVAVVPFNDAVASTPYVLHTHVEGAAELPDCLPQRTFRADRASIGSAPLPQSIAADTQSLILVDRARMARLYDMDSGEATAFWTKLQAYAASPLVKGVLVDVGAAAPVSEAYAAMDDDPCSVSGINTVVSRINDVVDDLRDGLDQLRFVTIIGNDDAIPMGRVPDLSDLANQLDYAPAARIGDADNAVSRSFATRYLLSDDPYGALAPSAYLDTQQFVPDLAVGRLVETPTEISATIDDFLASGGIRQLDGAFVASYDFLTDLGADLTKLAEARGGDVFGVHDSTWDRQLAQEKMSAHAGGLISINGHYDNNRALAANEDAKGTQDDLIEAAVHLPGADPDDPDVIANPDALKNSVLVTVGCNAGLNLSDLLLDTVSSATDREKSRTRDWAQRISAQKGVLVANTGFGYGDDIALDYSEKLVKHFAENLDGSMTIGQALQFAKHAYLNKAVMGVYDHKALHQATFFGIPQWRVGATGGVAPTVLPEAPSAPANPILAVSGTSLAPDAQLQTGDRGQWYEVATADPTVNEAPQVTAFRPVQPRTDEVLTPPASGLVAHGAVLEALKTTDQPIMDPAVSVPITDLAAAQPEPQVDDAFFPATLQQVVSQTTPQGRQDSLVLVTGQYRGGTVFDGSGAVTGVGTQRLVTQAGVQALWSDSDDFRPPQITVVDARIDPTERVGFRVDAPDADTARVFVLYLPATEGANEAEWKRLELEQTSSGRWTGSVVESAWDEQIGQFFVQAIDSAGNVTVNSNKGFNYRASLTVDPSDFSLDVVPGVDSATVYVVESTTASQSGDASTTQVANTYTYTIDGSDPQPYVDGILVAGRGSHVVAVTDQWGSEAVRVVVVGGGAPRITVLTPTSGGTYPDSGVATAFYCTDPAGPATSCVGDATLATVPGDHVFTVTSGGTTAEVPYVIAPSAVVEVLDPGAVQVTDKPVFTASLTNASGAPLKDRSLTFTFNGEELTSTTALDGVATAVFSAVEGPAPRTETLSVSLTGTSVSVDRDVSIVPEEVGVTYTGDLLASTGTAGAISGPVTLRARVEQPADGALGGPGAILNADVVFKLTRTDNGAQLEIPGQLKTASPDGVVLVVSTTESLVTGTYLVRPVVRGGWFQGEGEEVVVTVYTPSTDQFVTGGGHVDASKASTTPAAISTTDPKGHFGVNASFTKTTTTTSDGRRVTTMTPKGTAAFAFRAEDGRRFSLDAKTIEQLALGGGGKSKSGAVLPATASLTGPVSVWVTGPEDGAENVAVPGGFTWRVDVVDGGQSDTYAVTVYDQQGRVYLQVGRPNAQLPLTGGSVVVHK